MNPVYVQVEEDGGQDTEFLHGDPVTGLSLQEEHPVYYITQLVQMLQPCSNNGF